MLLQKLKNRPDSEFFAVFVVLLVLVLGGFYLRYWLITQQYERPEFLSIIELILLPVLFVGYSCLMPFVIKQPLLKLCISLIGFSLSLIISLICYAILSNGFLN